VNDLSKTSNLTPILFAVDTLLNISYFESANLQNGVNSELPKVDELMRHKFPLNYSKTPYICSSLANLGRNTLMTLK